MDNKNKSIMNESMFSAIDQIRQDSKDVRDFVKKVFADREFKKMSSDKEFIKYLKSIYEGTVLDEEQVKFSSRDSSGNITTTVREETINEGKKRFYQQDGIGRAKYTISYHDGKSKHKDGSDFYGIQILKNKKELEKFRNDLLKKGYREDSGFKKESVNEGKYNYKADALTAYFKGKLTAQELDKIARDDFKSGIATKKELNSFLSNKFTQDVMSDTYGIPAGALVKRVRGLMKFAEGKDDGVPQGYNPMVEDKSEIKGLVKKVGNKETKFYDVLSAMEKKYGKQKYRIWLEKSLKAFGANPKHYDYRTNAGAEEKLYQLGK